MKVGTILVATDLNPLYSEFIPSFITAWNVLIPEADVCIVLVAEDIPEALLPYAKNIRLFKPIPGIHTAFQAQCIRLLYPRQITRDEGVLITDMDMLPLSRRYYVDSIATIPDDHFIVYRDDCLPNEIAMCYNIAHPSTWASVFGDEGIATILTRWNSTTNYSGEHGGSGWNTDQLILVREFNKWNGNKTMLKDRDIGFQRLNRSLHYNLFRNHPALKATILSGFFVDYHCFRPYSAYVQQNDFVISCLKDTCLD
jgi:hypothetical protein